MRTHLLNMLLTGLIATAALAQTSTIRVDANLVLTPVGITDAEGNAIRTLKLEDFQIEENGIRIVPTHLGAPGAAPLELALIFDLSASVYPRFELERQAAASFLRRTMRPQDSVFILAIANEPRVLQERTSSLEAALQAIERITPTTQATSFNNSVIRAARMLREVERPEARLVMIAISDGEDNRSIENEQADVLKEIQLTNCLFYSINPNGPINSKSILSRRAQENLAELARQSGGSSFVTDKIEELEKFFDAIETTLQEQYLLGYYSPATSGRGVFRRISIHIKERPELQVKARPGYYPK